MSTEATQASVAIQRFVFPRWANYLVPGLVIVAIGILTYIPLVLGLFLAPQTTDARYQPQQPVPFSHAVHAGQLQIDCRYCHWSVEQTAFAALPTTKICMNCHASINSQSDKLQLVRDSYTTGQPISWIKVHAEPDFVYFDHAVHINKGVGCFSCHGRIDQMEVVYQHHTLSMAWCLSCHRDPANHLRPRSEITNMKWAVDVTGKTQAELGAELAREYDLSDSVYMVNCTLCHR